MIEQTLTHSTGSTTALTSQVLGRVTATLEEFLVEVRRLPILRHRHAEVPVAALSDLIANGGKRLRPMFCVVGFLAAGGDPEDRRILDAGAALEMLHAAALVHDDVIDSSDLRRGAVTVHHHWAAEHRARGWRGESQRFGDNVAIIAGDLALVYADILMTRAGSSVAQEWAELRSELIIGQLLDVIAAAESVADPQLAREIALWKSGRYTIQRPLTVGALLAGNAELAEPFTAYGLALGEAFQLRDDLMDFSGDSGTIGKPVGLDLARYKMTLLMAHAIQCDPRIRDVLDACEHGGAPVRTLHDALREIGVEDVIEARIDELVTLAQKLAVQAPVPGPWQDHLAVVAHKVAYRDR
jgi:geranylgeranyl diphosphate synthase type I